MGYVLDIPVVRKNAWSLWKRMTETTFQLSA